MKNPFHIEPLCPICGNEISGMIGNADRLYCFVCDVKWEMDLEEDR